MSKLQAIESALFSINETVFQELCDSYMALKFPNRSSFSRPGSQSRKQKTKKGTPDSFIVLNNGKYIFIEHSTNITARNKKLKQDILNCLDVSKTGVEVHRISEIILCVNFNLDPKEIEELMQLVNQTNVSLNVLTQQSLAIELYLNHRDLASTYLGLPLDTGQIVSIETFVKEYNTASTGIATPLDNPFQHREAELKEVMDALTECNLIFIVGAAGVGKTKLSIEAISEFLGRNEGFRSYCVSYKNFALLDDLYQYIRPSDNCILFVDDANRIDAFNQILGFYRSLREGQLKIVLTVRDYAFLQVAKLCTDLVSTKIDVPKISDEHIKDIIKAEPLKILNSSYQNKIAHIANGNPRLAIMAAKLANAQQNINSLSDVSDLFDNYFATFVKDLDKLGESESIKCLGIIAFFYTIPYRDRNLTSDILSSFDVSYEKFIAAIDYFEKLEIVDIQFEHVKISEQNISTYFFYRCFIKDELLSFDILLDKYFSSNTHRFQDTVLASNNTFGPKKVMNKLRPSLQKYLSLLRSEDVYSFLDVFWYYLQFETLDFLYQQVGALPTVESPQYDFKKKDTDAFNHSNILELLGNLFWHRGNLEDALSLAYEYIKKRPDLGSKLAAQIVGRITFEPEDEWDAYDRQIILLKSLEAGITKCEALHSMLFFEIAVPFLAQSFNHTTGGYRRQEIHIYRYIVPPSKALFNVRKKLFHLLSLTFDHYPKESIKILMQYTRNTDINKKITEFDSKLIIDIIEHKLTPTSFEHCLYVNEQVLWWSKRLRSKPILKILQKKFSSPLYDMYVKLLWDRLGNRDEYEFSDYTEYEQLKESDIRASFVFASSNQASQFYNDFLHITQRVDGSASLNSALDIIVDENFLRQKSVAFSLLRCIMESNNENNYRPWLLFKNHLKSKKTIEDLWNIINERTYNDKTLWRLNCLENIAAEFFNHRFSEYLMLAIEEADQSLTLPVNRYEKFTENVPDFYSRLLRVIVNKNIQSSIEIKVWHELFGKLFKHLGENIALIKKAYLQQDKFDKYFDYKGEGFLNILMVEPDFLLEYVDSALEKKNIGLSRDLRSLGFIWQVNDIEPRLNIAFDKVVATRLYYGITEHLCNSFFVNIPNELRSKADAFLLGYVRNNFTNKEKMNAVVDIVRHTRRELYENVLLLFVELTQDVTLFTEILWRGNGGSYSGNEIIGDIQAAEWRRILEIVGKSTSGIKLIPIKKYLNDRVQASLARGEREKKERFLEQ